jgi:hypothetical protein
MEPLSIALGLMQFAPSLMRYFGAGEGSVAVAEKVVDVAKAVTGQPTGPEALAALQQDRELAHQFNLAMLKMDGEIEQAYLADRKDARSRDTEFIKSGKRNYRADVMFVLAVAVICGLVWIVWKDPGINEYVKGIFTLVLGRFLGYLDNIYNFEFGTTRGSQRTRDLLAQVQSSK